MVRHGELVGRGYRGVWYEPLLPGKYAFNTYAYSLELQEVLIGTPHSSKGTNEQIEQILVQLRERQVAQEKVATYKLKEAAAVQERTLREAEAKAEQQKGITTSQISIDIKNNEGRAALAFAQQDAERIKVEAGANATRVKLEAEANAEKLRLEGEGEAKKVEQVGLAQARATQAQVNAFGGPQYQLTQQVMARFAEAVERGHIDIVPKVMVGRRGRRRQRRPCWAAICLAR